MATTTWRARIVLTAGMCAMGAAAWAQPTPLPRLVSVTGQGEVKALPDVAYVTLGVEARKPTLADARTQVNATVERLLALTRELKIDPKFVDASQLQVQPEYRWNEKDSQRVLLGYVVSRQVQVELRELEQLGPLLERALSAGANQVGGAQLDSTRRKQLEREALARAVDDARQDAETLARAANVRVGSVFSLNASQESPPVFYARGMERAAMAAPMADAAEQSYGVGEMRFSATVSAQWELTGPAQ
ncbi:MAG: SIMPL domain-containing protein [Steroidobacteraceae bacterium]